MAPVRLVPVAVDCGAFEARVIAARLGAEGIVWSLRGADGVYPVGGTDVLVIESDADRARELLDLGEVGGPDADAGQPDADEAGWSDAVRLLPHRRVLAVVALAALVVLVRLPWW